MADIKAILLIPAEGDPLGLLATGPCGARPPIATELGSYGSRKWFAGAAIPAPEVSRLRVALVLAWDGKVVVEGIGRALRCAPRQREWEIERRVRDYLHSAARAARIVHPSLGIGVLLDAEGREVSRG